MNSNLGERVRAAREARGLTRAELARRVKLTSTAVLFLENGKTQDLAGGNVFPMADALGVSARWLVTGKGPMTGPDGPQGTPRDEAVARLAQALAMVDEVRLQAVMTLLNLKR